MKETKSGKRASLATEKSKKVALINGSTMQKRSRYRENKLRTAGKLWCDADFETLKLDPYCQDIIESAVVLPKKDVRIFRAWEEEWEKVKVGPKGNIVLEAKLVTKYDGLCWMDRDTNYQRVESHPDKMFFDK